MKKNKKEKRSKKEKKDKKLKKSTTRKKSSKSIKGKKAEKVTVSAETHYKEFRKPKDIRRLTAIEYLKLIRNCVLILILIAAIFVFLKDSVAVSEEIDLIIIFSAILFTLIAFLLFVFFIKSIQDIKNGIVDIFEGIVQKGSVDVLYSSYSPICMIVLDRKVHHVGVNHYLKIKNGDSIILRRTLATRSIVSLKILRKEK
jgi:ABC-type multidrug transport system fused ATPase/permease subunit